MPRLLGMSSTILQVFVQIRMKKPNRSFNVPYGFPTHIYLQSLSFSCCWGIVKELSIGHCRILICRCHTCIWTCPGHRVVAYLQDNQTHTLHCCDHMHNTYIWTQPGHREVERLQNNQTHTHTAVIICTSFQNQQCNSHMINQLAY